MNIRIVDGNLVKDAEVKTSKSGAKYLSLVVANNSYVNHERVPVYFNVVSYDSRLIERQSGDNKPYIKGKAVVITGHPNETITVKDGKAYLNRNIVAMNIETHNFSMKKEEVNDGVYHTVAPICESPKVAQPSASVAPVQAPVYTTKAIEPSVKYSNPVVEAPVVASPLPAEVGGVEDDLPF
jgi:single-stranded DNA-binding protein